jgi:hypothetical protein
MDEKTLEVDQQSRMIVRSSTRTNFKTIVDFCNGNHSLVLELIPTVDLLSSDDRRLMWIAEPQLASGLICYPKSAQYMKLLKLLVSQTQSSIL